MRWFIEVSNVGSGDPDTQYCVEAKQWQAALQQARKLRGEGGPLSAFAIELLDNGYRAVDKKQNLKYVVKKAPNDAPLSDGKNGSASPAAQARSKTAVTEPPESLAPEATGEAVRPASSPRASGPPPKPKLESTRPAEAKSSPSGSKPSSNAPERKSNPAKKGPQKVAELLAAAALKAGKKAKSYPVDLKPGSSPKAAATAAPATSTTGDPGSSPNAAPDPLPVSAAPVAVEEPPLASATAVDTQAALVSSAPDAAVSAPADAAVAPPAGDPEPARPDNVSAPALVPVEAPVLPSVEVQLQNPAPASEASEGVPATASAEPAVLESQGQVRAAAPAAPVEVPDYEVIRTRAEDPSEGTPITYREVALGVKPGIGKAAIEALLWARLASEQKELNERPKGKFVQLAVFDHVFSKKPIRPPLATLQWKDWRGDPMLHFSELASAERAPEPQAPHAEPERGSLRPTSVIPVGDASQAPAASANAAVAVEAAAQGSSPVQAPEPIPEAVAKAPEPAPLPPAAAETEPGDGVPDSMPAIESADAAQIVKKGTAEAHRQPVSDDLIGVLFEKMHELHFMSDVVAGSDFVLTIVKETLPSAFVLIQVFDINTKNFVVVRQHGASEKALLFQTSDQDGHLRRVMRPTRSTNMKGASKDGALLSGRWQAAAAAPDCLLCGPVKQGGRYLGLIELGNPMGTEPFAEVEANALDYICEQFAEFLANRPIVLDAELILK